MGRISTALRALRGHAAPCRTCALRIEQMEARYMEHQVELTGYMEKMNAWAARQARRDKRLIEGGILADLQPQAGQIDPGATGQTSKEQLRQRLAASLATGRMAGRVPAGVAGHFEGPEGTPLEGSAVPAAG